MPVGRVSLSSSHTARHREPDASRPPLESLSGKKKGGGGESGKGDVDSDSVTIRIPLSLLSSVNEDSVTVDHVSVVTVLTLVFSDLRTCHFPYMVTVSSHRRSHHPPICGH